MGIRQAFTRTGGVLVSKLTQELAASLSIEGCAFLASGDVAVDFVSAPSAQDLIDAQAIIDAHDATDYVQQVQTGAKSQVQNVPNWATWDEATALSWYDTNVTSAADALPVLRAMIRLVIALRNETWPELQE